MTQTTSDLIPEDQRDRFDQTLAALRKDGFIDLDEHEGLKVGSRVRHRGEQYPEAYRDGTAVVLALLRKPNDAWSRQWGRPNIELLVLPDRDRFDTGNRIGQWADYHTATAPDPAWTR